MGLESIIIEYSSEKISSLDGVDFLMEIYFDWLVNFAIFVGDY